MELVWLSPLVHLGILFVCVCIFVLYIYNRIYRYEGPQRCSPITKSNSSGNTYDCHQQEARAPSIRSPAVFHLPR